MPILSIITINRNNLDGLKRTVESVVNQTWQEFEYVIIDGGSTDGSAAYIESQSAHIDYWVSDSDKGIYNAMNKGIVKATGDYLLFLNSGDHLFNDTVLQETKCYLASYDLICFDMQEIGNKTSKIISLPDSLRFSDLFFETMPHPSTFIKKELFTEVGLYDEKLKIVSDWKFFILALFKHNCSYNKVNQTVTTFYLGGISSGTGCAEEREQVLKENFSNYFKDYKEFDKTRKLLETNRFKLLIEIEKTTIGKKIVSLFFRTYVVLFLKKQLKNIVKNNGFFS